MNEPVWVPAALTAVTGCLGYAALCWASGFLPDQASAWPSAVAPDGYCRMVMLALLLHEAWVTLQHGNVLLNPFCQRLDRRYGISMLRKGQHWVIASVLVMYWAREVASMLLCLPYISTYSQIAVFVSTIYHTVKMFNICLDAHRCWSPTLGIMKLLIDHWHFQTLATQLVSLLRFSLQGYDTLVHVLIVRDLIHHGGLGTGYVWWLHILFLVWLVHAVLNQVSQKSTSTLVVEAWRYALGFHKKKVCDDTSCHAPTASGHSCVVCDLLKEDSSKLWKGKTTSSRTAEQKQMLAATFTVQIGALMYAAILFHMDVLRLGAGSQEGLIRNDVLFLHEAWVMLQHANVLLNPFCQRLDRRYGVSMLRKGQHWVIAGVLVMYWSREVISMLLCLAFTSPRTQLAILVSSAYHLVKMHSICCDAQRQWSPNLGIMRLLIDHWHFETLAQRLVSALRLFLQGSDTLTHVMIVRDMLTRSGSPTEAGRLLPLHFLFLLWVVHAAFNQATQKSTATLFVEAWRAVLYRQEPHAGSGSPCTSCGAACQVCSLLAPAPEPGAAKVDVVFVSHPPYPSSLFSLWSSCTASSNRQGWVPAWWMYLLGPPLSLVIPWLWPMLRNGQGFEVAEDVGYAGVHMQNWVMACYGYQYLLWPFRSFVAARIASTALAAEKRGVRVLCLGALNKAEWMNNGGLGLLSKMEGGMRIVHGNTLTAAAVVEAARGLFGPAASVTSPLFLTGASSKVGAAVALRLLQLGYPVLAHSSDPERLRRLAAKAQQLDPKAADKLEVTTTLVKGVYTPYWIVGKHDARVPHYLPRGSRAVVFSVPNPIEESGRKDVVWVPGGILRLDGTRLAKPRQFSNLLAPDEIYACHAAGMVTAANPEWKDELGEVSVDAMSTQWEAALRMGFSLPPSPPSSPSTLPRNRLSADVVVIGAGPSGLATAAALAQRGVDVVVLERQEKIQGSWQEHFEGLTITTRAAACGLPGWPVKLATGSDELAADDYVQYLRAFAARFSLDVRCGVEVNAIEDQSGEWCISTTGGAEGSTRKWLAKELVIATGKSVAPCIPGLWSREVEKEVPSVFHSSQVKGPTLQRVVAAASKGELLVVGFGNSAADLCSQILRQVPGGTAHVSLRRVPPIMRRQWGPLRLEWFARLFSYACDKNGDRLAQWMMHLIEGDIQHLFPADLPRWTARKEKHIPTIDRDGWLVRQLRDGIIVPHRGIESFSAAADGKLDIQFMREGESRQFSAVVLCTGYKTSLESQQVLSRDAVRARAFFVGLGPEPRDLLPLQGIGREAQKTASQVCDMLSLKRRQRCEYPTQGESSFEEPSSELQKDKDL